MHSSKLARAALLMVILVIASIASWEFYLRSKGIRPSYDEGGPLWADKRAMVYEPKEKSTVFIGSSRIKFDLDIDTWKNLTGDQPIQLAIVGSSPVPVLMELANDEKFKGKLVIDVLEPIFFSEAPFNLASPNQFIKYYKDRTPAQRASFALNHVLESKLAFLDKDFFSLNAMLYDLDVKDRPGVYSFPPYPGFPRGFGTVTFDRRSLMTDDFVADTNQHNQVINIWKFVFTASKGMPPPTQGQIDTMIAKVKSATDRIKARGGEVLFVRCPSSPPLSLGEKQGFPRDVYWNKLLSATQCQGIHYEDYPAINHFICPEWSHLKPADAIPFTTELVRILREEKGWKFPKNSAN